MRIVLAPDKFKGSLTAIEAADAMAAGIRSVDSTIEIDPCPMADGGEGTVDALVRAKSGRLITRRVTGPLPEMKVDATIGFIDGDQTAVIEMAAASGLHLLRPDQYDPLATTTFGTGELIVEAIKIGAKKVILGIGGSATIDAGLGCLQACGFTIVLLDGELVSPTEPLCGRAIERVALVKRHRGERSAGVEFLVASDVSNPLYGPNGAAHVFGPQKGATPQVIDELDAAMKQLATRTNQDEAAKSLGAGAAGGLGFAMIAFVGATLRPGVELVIEATNLRDRLARADLCLTGEGRLDTQTLSGKVVAGVGGACRELHRPCIAIVGQSFVDDARLADLGLTDVFVLVRDGITSQDAMVRARERVTEAAARALRSSRAS